MLPQARAAAAKSSRLRLQRVRLRAEPRIEEWEPVKVRVAAFIVSLWSAPRASAGRTRTHRGVKLLRAGLVDNGTNLGQDALRELLDISLVCRLPTLGPGQQGLIGRRAKRAVERRRSPRVSLRLPRLLNLDAAGERDG